MERTNEDKVTRLLSMSEILKRRDTVGANNNTKQYPYNSEYDLSHYLKTEATKQQRYMDKYLFVK